MTGPRATRILVLPVGSHGDVHPLLGIARALTSRGHDVTVISNGHFEPLIRQAGLQYAGLGTDQEFREGIADPDVWHPLRGFQTVMRRGVFPFMARTHDFLTQNFSPDDTLIVAAAIAFGARVARETHGFRLVTTQLQPVTMRSLHHFPQYPGPVVIPQRAPKWVKRAAWRIVDLVADHVIAPELNRFRHDRGLHTPVRRILDQWWLSPDLVLGLWPDWYGPPQPDWPPQLRLTGFPLFDEAGITPLDPHVSEFLGRNPGAIAFTPGSAHLHAHAFFEQSANACTLLSRPGLLLTRHPDQIPRQLPPNVIHVPYAPFSELLPRCAALVHHGGIGTTAQALRAACPQLIMPLSHDQPDNAARVTRLGVGRTLPPRHYKARNVARLLTELLTSPATAANCAAVAAKFQGTDPLTRACEEIESLLLRPHHARESISHR